MKCILAGIFFLLVFGGVTMLLWNWLVPAVFNGPEIRFLEALGLLLLAKILFSGWGGGRWRPGRHSWNHSYYEKLSSMSPEARERFKARMREKWRCGGPPAEEANTGSSNV